MLQLHKYSFRLDSLPLLGLPPGVTSPFLDFHDPSGQTIDIISPHLITRIHCSCGSSIWHSDTSPMVLDFIIVNMLIIIKTWIIKWMEVNPYGTFTRDSHSLTQCLMIASFTSIRSGEAWQIRPVPRLDDHVNYLADYITLWNWRDYNQRDIIWKEYLLKKEMRRGGGGGGGGGRWNRLHGHSFDNQLEFILWKSFACHSFTS